MMAAGRKYFCTQSSHKLKTLGRWYRRQIPLKRFISPAPGNNLNSINISYENVCFVQLTVSFQVLDRISVSLFAHLAENVDVRWKKRTTDAVKILSAETDTGVGKHDVIEAV